MRCFFLGFAGFFIAAIIAAVAISSYGDYAARASLDQTMASVDRLRIDIAENIVNHGTLTNSGVSLNSSKEKPAVSGADYLKVTNDGTIIFRSARHGQIIVLEPSYNAGVLNWKCVGSKPEKNIPPSCY